LPSFASAQKVQKSIYEDLTAGDIPGSVPVNNMRLPKNNEGLEGLEELPRVFFSPVRLDSKGGKPDEEGDN
jgi:hypothetical protein